MTGTIFLYDGERIIKAVAYHAKGYRKEVIARWEKEVGETFNRMSIQIAPNANTDRITIHGTNTRKVIPAPVQESKTPLIRPVAIYDNQKSLYDF